MRSICVCGGEGGGGRCKYKNLLKINAPDEKKTLRHLGVYCFCYCSFLGFPIKT